MLNPVGRADGRDRSRAGTRRSGRGTPSLLAEPDPQGQRGAGDPVEQRDTQTGEYYHNTLFTQVALRSLAFVDRYR